MPMLSRLKPDSATLTGILTAAGVFLIYQNALPTLADIRVAEPHNNDVEQARRHAAWASAALIGVVFVVSKDLNSYIISGAGLIAIDYLHKHSNATSPASGKLDTSGGGTTVAPGQAVMYAMPDYDEAGA
jgi:hypothetical protein